MSPPCVRPLSLFTCLVAHLFDMLGGDRGITTKYRNHEAPRITSSLRFWLLRKGKTDETHTLKQSVAYAEDFHRGGFIQWHMVVICLWCAVFVTSQFDVIFMFPSQRFGEVC